MLMKNQIAKCFALSFLLMSSFVASVAQAGSVSDICLAIASYDSSAAVRCSGLIGNNSFDSGAVDVCAAMQPIDYMSAISCISTISNHNYDDVQATPLCARVVKYDMAASLSCLQVTADMSYPNNSAAVCDKIMNTDYQGAIACLKSVGQAAPTKPACPKALDATTALKAALQSLDAYDITTARKNLVQLLTSYEICQ